MKNPNRLYKILLLLTATTLLYLTEESFLRFFPWFRPGLAHGIILYVLQTFGLLCAVLIGFLPLLFFAILKGTILHTSTIAVLCSVVFSTGIMGLFSYLNFMSVGKRKGSRGVLFGPVSMGIGGIVFYILFQRGLYGLLFGDTRISPLFLLIVPFSGGLSGLIAWFMGRRFYPFFLPLTLVSHSPRRKELLTAWGLRFSLMPVDSELPVDLSCPAGENVKKISLYKAEQALKQQKEGLLIAADTLVVLNGEIIGKPRTEEEAEKILSKLSGTTHQVYTGLVVIDARDRRRVVQYDKSRVTMKELTMEEIKAASSEHMDKAGAYAVQEEDAFVDKIEGSYSNVVGLPRHLLKEMLSCFGVYF